MHRIQENLTRQHKALELLFVLLEEEFSRLMERNSRNVTPLELSIQELMRQLAAERVCLRGMVQAMDPTAQRVREIVEQLEPELASAVADLLAKIDKVEQRCGIQANKNQQLALALYDQSTKLLTFMQKQISPPVDTGSYSAKGRYRKNSSSQATILHGRF
ncbi:MAG: flagellar export chaperone FlgN [Desulfovibrionaceae bacterium]